MNKRKLRFNFIDVLIILVILAVAAVLLYVFVLSDNNDQIEELNYSNIQYVIEIQNVDKQFEGAVQVGQLVKEAVKQKYIGTVSGVEAVPYQMKTFDYELGIETVSYVEDKITLKITIDAQAVETDRAFTVDGYEIRVGKSYSLALPNMYCSGFCTFLKDGKQ